MGYRISWHNPLPQNVDPDMYPEFNEVVVPGMQAVANKVVGPDTEVVFHHFANDGEAPMDPYLKIFTDAQMIEGVIQSEQEGYDAALVGCYYDPGLLEARCATEFPVAGVAESSMLLAHVLGRKFACVTLTPLAVPLLERNVRLSGLGDNAIERPIRTLKIEYPDMWDRLIRAYKGDGDDLIASLEEAAYECIEAGADIITTGCVWFGPALTHLGYREIGNTGVQVIDCFSAGLGMLEMQLKLAKNIGVTRSSGDNSFYTSPEPNMFRRQRCAVGLSPIGDDAGAQKVAAE